MDATISIMTPMSFASMAKIKKKKRGWTGSEFEVSVEGGFFRGVWWGGWAMWGRGYGGGLFIRDYILGFFFFCVWLWSK
jgi:hypothetical protein